MTTHASAVASQNDHGYEAGRYVATHALAAFQSPPTLLVASIGAQHPQAEVVRGIRSIAGTSPLIGCSATSVITMAGIAEKGVGMLALRSDKLQAGLALATRWRNQPALAAEHAVEQAQRSLPPSHQAGESKQHAVLLMLANEPERGNALEHAAHQCHSRVGARCTVVGVAAGSEQGTAHQASVFVNDQVADDGLAVALLRSPTPPGIGTSDYKTMTLSEAAQDAARQAVAALGSHPPVAAVVVVAGSPPPANENTTPEPPEIAQFREAIGRATPFVGIYSPGLVLPERGAGGPAGWHQKTVLVCALGKE